MPGRPASAVPLRNRVSTRPTSSAYRFPLTSSSSHRRRPVSAYHERCMPQKSSAGAQTNNKGSSGDGDGAEGGGGAVRLDKIWRQRVDDEKRGLKNWRVNWGFLTEFNEKGEHKEPEEEIPEAATSVFSDTIPNTNSGNYGLRLNSQIGQGMQNMEFQFYGNNRRRTMGTDLICY